MADFLVGILYHDPESFAWWNRGIVEDYESSTGLFVEADTAAAALGWGEKVGEALLRHVNQDASLDWKGLGYFFWLEELPTESDWKHCPDRFQHVRVDQMPDLRRMNWK